MQEARNQAGVIEPAEHLSVLVIEDDPDFVEFLRQIFFPRNPDLLPLFLTTIEASAGAECNCIVLDLMLDKTTGLDSIRRTRDLHPETPIIVVSSLDCQPVSFVRAGADDCVRKHNVVEQLAPRIRSAVERVRRYNQRIPNVTDDQIKRVRRYIEAARKFHGMGKGR